MSKLAVLIAILALTAGASNAQQAAASRDAAMKAVMVYNFARFTTWPSTRFTSTTAPVAVCVASSSPLAPALGRLTGQPVGARRLVVRLTYLPGPACHLAYVDAEDATPARLASLHSQGVLTVGEGRDFSERGAVALVTVGRQVRFQVNVRATRDAGVRISSQLLRLAMLVRS